MTMEPIRFTTEKGLATLIPIPSGYVNNVVLVANTNEEFTIPSGATIVFFSFDVPIWVSFGDETNHPDAAVPSADVVDGTGSIFNPGSRNIGKYTRINIISDFAAKGSLEFYGTPTS